MISQSRSVAAILISTSAVLVTVGCEDTAARHRQQVQKTITDLSRELQIALAGGTSSTDVETVSAQQQKINGIVTRLGQINGGEPGQQSAKSLLSATALRELANTHLASAEQTEAQHRAARMALQGKIDAALKLDAVATAMESVDAEAQRRELQQQLDTAKAHANELTEKISQLSGPIAERSTQNAANQKELDQLRVEVGELRRKATELGSADGFDTFKHSIDVNRQADKIEYDISQREIDLDYSLNPEHSLVDTQFKHLQAMMQAIEATQASLNAFSQASAADVQTTRASIKTLVGHIKEELARINGESTGALKAAYDDALVALDKAATQAQAARGDDAAKMLAVRISEAQGRAHWSRAQGLAEQKQLLQQVINGGKSLGADSLNDELKSVSAEYDQAIEQAKAAYAIAKDALSQLGTSNPAQIESFQRNLQASIDVLSGKEPEPEPVVSRATPTRERALAQVQEFVPKGAESPEALVQTLKALSGPTDMLKIFDLMTPVDQIPNITSEQRGFLKNLVKLAAGTSALDAALQRKFGKSIADLPGASAGFAGGQMPNFDSVSLGAVNGDRGTILSVNPRGAQVSHEIRRINGRWFMNMDTPGMHNMGSQAAAAADPQASQMADNFMRGMSDAFGKMGAMFQELAAAVDRGEFSSFDDFKVKSDERMTNAMKGSPLGGLIGVDQPSGPK